MAEDFLLRAVAGGLGVAVTAAVVGCFVVWRRLSYFGVALSHSALLGVALGLLLGVAPMATVIATCLALALLFAAMERWPAFGGDTVLGVLAHVSLAAGIVAMAFMEQVRFDLMGYLFGDILAVSYTDLAVIYATAVIVLGVMAWLWRSLLSLTVHEEMARVEGVDTRRVRVVYLLLLALTVAVGMKVVGMLMIASLLIIPPAAARRLSSTPEAMAVGAAVIAAVSVLGGLWLSWQWDLPSGPAIVLIAALAFAVIQLTALAPFGLARRGGGG
jgi:zinc transport system permease protein